jgi:hypothetical protein
VPTLALADFMNEKQFEEFVKGLLSELTTILLKKTRFLECKI